MINIAIVDDEVFFSDILKDYIERYSRENKIAVNIKVHSNALALLENYTAAFDIIFMDIKMPHLNGMDAARRLREIDKTVILIFVTEMVQFAVNGYEVSALDYIVKPIKYYDFSLKFARAVKALCALTEPSIVVPHKSGYKKINPLEIKYIEISGHRVIFHTVSGDFEKYSSLTAVEKLLEGLSFERCNNCYLVNLRFVESIKGYTAYLKDEQLQISQPRKRHFLKKFLTFIGEKNNG